MGKKSVSHENGRPQNNEDHLSVIINEAHGSGSMGSWLSVLVNFSFSYNTIFLSSVSPSRSSPVNTPFGESSFFLKVGIAKWTNRSLKIVTQAIQKYLKTLPDLSDFGCDGTKKSTVSIKSLTNTSRVTNTNFLPTISIHHQKKRLRESKKKITKGKHLWCLTKFSHLFL